MGVLKKIDKSEHANVVNLYLSGKSSNKISKLYKVSVTPIQRILRENNVKVRNQFLCGKTIFMDEFYFDKIDMPSKAYVLGLFYTDGNNHEPRARLAIGLNDLEVIEFIQKEFKTNKKIYEVPINGKDRKNIQYRLDITNRKVSAKLAEIGCKSNKTETLKFPDKIFLPIELVKFFILGCFDGDGCLIRYRNRFFRWNFIGTFDMCNQIKFFIEKTIKVSLKIRKAGKHRFLFCLDLYKLEEIKKLLRFLYDKAPFKMKRKYKMFLELENTKFIRKCPSTVLDIQEPTK